MCTLFITKKIIGFSEVHRALVKIKYQKNIFPVLHRLIFIPAV